jgi:hypothetical protein
METTTYSTALIFILIVGLAIGLRMKITDLERRFASLRRLEAKIDLLLKQDNLVYEPVAGVHPAILEAVQAGEVIRAVSLYRTLHNCSLKEAKEAIERITAQLSP